MNSNNESVREEELTAFIDLRRARGASSLPFERRARTYAREAACFRPLRRTAPSGGSRKISHQGHPMSGSTPNCTTSQQIELGLTATHRSTDRTRKGGVAYAGESSGKGHWWSLGGLGFASMVFLCVQGRPMGRVSSATYGYATNHSRSSLKVSHCHGVTQQTLDFWESN